MIKILLEKLVTKKKLITWIAAALIPIIGVAVSLDTNEVKEAICGAE